jgi:thiol-disulfide isomerase/thioredoxin
MPTKKSLYKSTDPVVILTDKDIKGTRITKKSTKAKPCFDGVVKVYASWCPHCIEKVRSINNIAGAFKKLGMKQTMYVIDGDVNQGFAKAAGIEGFPTFFPVMGGMIDTSRRLPSDVTGVLTHMCSTCVGRPDFKLK